MSAGVNTSDACKPSAPKAWPERGSASDGRGDARIPPNRTGGDAAVWLHNTPGRRGRSTQEAHGQICWAELLSALLCEGKQSWWNDGNFHSSTLCTSTIDYWSLPPTTILSICQSIDGKSTATFEGDTGTAACGTHLSPGPTLPTAIWLSLVERNSQVPTDATGTSASISGNA